MILIYSTGKSAFKEAEVAEVASYLYVFVNIYTQQLPHSSENTYMFFSLLGMYALYSDVEEMLPMAPNFFIGIICWGCCTFTKWIGVLHFVFIAYYILLKIIAKSDRFCKLFEYLMILWVSILVMALPLWTSMSWAPYVLHCNTRLDRTN